MKEERIVTLEIKFAYQEEVLQKLDTIIQEQQTRIENLETANKYLADKFNALQASTDSEITTDLPPHY